MVDQGVATCTVPLRPGRNSVVLLARDAAGHVTSRGIRVTRTGTSTTLTLTPATRTLLVEESAALSLLDDFGSTITAATWTTSDPAVIDLSTDDPPVLTALASGTATITAAKNGLSATATITVVAGTSLPDGTTRWSVAPTQGTEMLAPVHTHRIGEDGPDLFAVESDSASGQIVLRALTRAGAAMWTEVVPGTPMMGAWSGGVIAAVPDALGSTVGLAHVATSAPLSPWVYRSPGYVGETAMAPDGTVFALEQSEGTSASGDPIWDRAIVVLDGATGLVRARVGVPRDVFRNTATSSCGAVVSEQRPWVSAIVVGRDGRAYLQVRQLRRVNTRAEGYACDQMSKTVDYQLQLWAVAPDGTLTTELIYRHQFAGSQYACDWVPLPGDLVPDGRDGLLATWARYTCGTSESKVSRFADADAWSAQSIAENTRLVMTGDAGTAYLMPQTGGSVTAMDVPTWTEKWTVPATGGPLMAVRDGGLLMHDPMAGTAMMITPAGSSEPTTSLPLGSPSASLAVRNWLGLNVGTGWLAELTGQEAVSARRSFVNGRGDLQGTRSEAPITIDNTGDGAATLLAKLERDGEFDIVSPGDTRRYAFDGVKPDAWRLAGAELYSGDWYKVSNGLGVRFWNVDGQPERFAPASWNTWLLMIPECHFDSAVCVPPGTGPLSGYRKLGGRKKEPEWSRDLETNWRYPPQ